MTTIMAHRGARNIWAENSLVGFRNVRALGVKAVEFDMHLGADGEILVIHDATLDRTTTGTGPVRSLTEVRRHDLRLIGPEGEVEETVPLLSEVLDILAPALGIHLMPEFKADETGHTDPALIRGVIDMLRRYKLTDRVTLHSFDIDVLRTVAVQAPEIRRMISVNAAWAARQGGVEPFFKSVRDLVSVVGVHHDLFEQAFEQITALWPLERLGVWTLNDPDQIARWLARGPGYLTSDDPRLACDLMARRRTP